MKIPDLFYVLYENVYTDTGRNPQFATLFICITLLYRPILDSKR